ncbi:MAG: sigma-70 family RNA polymerase sigma factor [Planctomycetota bacterium]
MTGVPQDLDLGTLLAEQSFVRRLARSLVYDADVDDVVQQAWLRAVETRRGTALPARPFLARLVRGVSSNWRRAEGRRRRREAEGPVAEPSPAVADAFARESVRQEVVAELAALAEPYRSTLVLRYFEDLTPIEIARRQGVPDATVRARLKRGLDALRRRLDRRYGDDRAAWCTALLPLADAGRDAAPLAAMGAAASFGLHHLLVPAAAVLLIVGLATWFGDERPAAALEGDGRAPELAAAAPATTATPVAAPHDVRAALPEPAPAPRVAAGDAAADNGVRGRLVLPDGSPAPARRVRVVGFDAARLFEGDPTTLAAAVPWAEAETESDADGRFLLRDVRPRALMLLQAGRGSDHSACMPIAHTAGPDQVVDLGDVVLEARACVRGRVEDEDGEPVADAEVWFADVPAVITLAANFDRFVPAHGGMLMLPKRRADEALGAFAARTRTFLAAELFVKQQSPGPDADVLVLDTPPWFDRAWQALPLARTTTAADGTFELLDVPPGVGMLVARRAGLAPYVKASLRVRASEARDVGALALGAGETCVGSVRDHRGNAVAGAAVRVASLPLGGFRGLAFTEAEVRTDAGGTFRVSGLGRGQVMVAARSANDRPWTTLGPIDVAAAADLRLAAPSTLRVRVADAAQVQVRLSYGPPLGELARMGMRTAVDVQARLTVDADDHLTITDLVPGTYLIEARADGRVATTRLVEVPGDLALDMAAAAPTFDVLVVTAGNEPLAGARVRCAPADLDLSRSVLPTYVGLPRPDVLADDLGCTDERGLLQVSGRATGPLVLWADHPRYGRAQLRVELPSARVVLQLPSAATLRGVLTEKGQPASPARWRVAVEPTPRADGQPRPFALATLRADGSFELTGLEPGAHTVLVQKALPARLDVTALKEMMQERIFAFFGPGAQRERAVVLRPGEVRELRLDTDAERDPPATPLQVSGRILVDGRPARGLKIGVTAGGGLGLNAFDLGGPRARTDDDGSFVVTGVEEGLAELTVVRADADVECTLVRHPTVIAPSAVNEVALSIETGTLVGRVLAPADRDLDGISVYGSGPSGAQLRVRAGADGSFEARGLPAGRWQLSFSGTHVAAPPTETTVELVAGRSHDVQLQAEPGFSLEVQLEDVAPDVTHLVQLEFPGQGASWANVTDAKGQVTFSGLRAGTYSLATFGDPKLVGEVDLHGDAVHRVTMSRRGITPRQ